MGQLSLALVAAGLFATTNVDDLFLLVGFFSDRNLAPWQVVAGQIIGVSVLIAISLTAALAALAYSPSYVGLLGFAPIVLGASKFRSLMVDRRAVETSAESRGQVTTGGAAGVGLVTIASGADNIGVYTPFFAAQSGTQIAIIIFVFGVLTLTWCFIARWLVAHRAIGACLRSIAPILLPVVLIALGVSILYTSGAGAFFMRWFN
jgi:cadmium resistance protein CadD (predicted permease)